MENKLELRMYSLVLYQLREIQAGIQAGHANVEYGLLQGMGPDTPFYDWASNWKTVIILNGGSSTTLKVAIEELDVMRIPNTVFREPDLDNIVTAVSFLVDERVFNREKYPDFDYFLAAQEIVTGNSRNEWVESVGGEKNAFLREWLRKFRLA